MIEEIREVDQLSDLFDDWLRLLPSTTGASFFHYPQWLEIYWRHFGNDQKLRVLVDRHDGEVRGILPLVVTSESTRAGRFRLLSFPLAGWGTWYSSIGGEPEQTLAAGLEHIRSSRRDWDVFDLRWIADAEASMQAFQTAGLAAYSEVWGIAPTVDLTGDWADYWASRKSKWRKNIRRNEGKTAALGAVSFDRFRPAVGEQHVAEKSDRMYEDCLAIAGRSWQNDATDGTTLSDDSIEPFLRECHHLATDLGCVDMNVLRINDQPIAYAYNYIYNGEIAGLRMGYDAEFSKAGAGSVLMKHIIEDSFARGDQVFDLGLESEQAKRYWQNSERIAHRICHYPTVSLRAQSLRLKRWASRLWRGPRPAMKKKHG